MPCQALGPPTRLRAFVTGGIMGLARNRVLHARRGRGVGQVFEICALPTCGLLLNPASLQIARVLMDISDQPR